MVAAPSSGGPGGRGAFRYRWDGARVAQQHAAQIQAAMTALARDLETYLHETLHRDTGEMADKAFATVAIVGSRFVIRAGSDADHTVYHEFRYHPQLRQAMDLWGPRIVSYLRAQMRGGA